MRGIVRHPALRAGLLAGVRVRGLEIEISGGFRNGRFTLLSPTEERDPAVTDAGDQEIRTPVSAPNPGEYLDAVTLQNCERTLNLLDFDDNLRWRGRLSMVEL